VDHPSLLAEAVTFPGATGEVKGYLARPREGAGQLGSVIVVHGNRGLNAHIEDVSRRFALEGFMALGVDFLSPLGGTPAPDLNSELRASDLDPVETVADALVAANWLRGLPNSNGKVGATGYCWGGGVVNRLAVADPLLSAAVPYYGAVPDAADVPKIQAPLLLNYADPSLDTRLGAQLPGYEAALQAAGKSYTLYTYEGAQHAFNDDTQVRYHQEAADLAWSRTLAFFREHLS
jgi:carboxymethylenebutenolidase